MANRKDIHFLVVLAILLVSMVISGLRFIDKNKEEIAIVSVETEDEVAVPDYFEGIELYADAAFVWDMKNRRVLFEKSANEVKNLASISKIMTAYIAAQRSELEPVIEISEEHLDADGDAGLIAFERWSVSDLIDFTLMVSSNDGAKALASVAAFAGGQEGYGESGFLQEMNKKGSSIGLGTLSFENASGLDLDDQMTNGGVGTARDVSLLVDEVLRVEPDILEATAWPAAAFKSINGFVHSGENTNPLTRELPFMLASKTGYTDLAGGNLTVAFDVGPGRPIVITVLDSGWDERFEDVRKLYHATLKTLQHVD